MESREDEYILAYSPVKIGETFRVEYTHSIHLSQVVEWYNISKNQHIVQTKLTYEDMAIGMPSSAEAGEVFTMTTDGQYEIGKMNRIFPSISMRIGKVKANHLLHIQDRTYPFTSYFEGGSGVKLSVGKLSLWQMWKGVNVHE